MFSSFFKRKPDEPDRPEAALAAAPALLDQLLEAASDDLGIRIETVVLALGSLAGQAAQLAALESLRRRAAGYAGLSLAEVQGANGDCYWFGDAINRPVAEGPFSLWHAVAAASESRGAGALPDIHALFSSVSARIGGESFDDERQAIALYWPEQKLILTAQLPDPVEWPIAYGFAFTRLVAMTGDQFPFLDLAESFMRSAIIASKLQV